MSADLTDPAWITDLTALDTETARLLATARSLTDGALLEPSLCAGWSRAHVLSHIDHNAAGLTNVIRAAVDQAPVTMYPSDAARDRDIEAGSTRDAAELADAIETGSAGLRTELQRLAPEHDEITVERTPGGAEIPVAYVPYLRLREVIYHHVDLDAGFTFANLPIEQQTFLLSDETERLDDALSLRLVPTDGPEIALGAGAVSVHGTTAALLLWLARQDPSGVTSDALPELTGG